MRSIRCFYAIKKGNLTVEDFRNMHEKLSKVCGGEVPCQIHYHEASEWVPVFEKNMCENSPMTSDEIMTGMEAISGNPVVALSTWNGDIGFVSVCEGGAITRYISANGPFGGGDGSLEFKTDIQSGNSEWGTSTDSLSQLRGAGSEIYGEGHLYELAGMLGMPAFSGGDLAGGSQMETIITSGPELSGSDFSGADFSGSELTAAERPESGLPGTGDRKSGA